MSAVLPSIADDAQLDMSSLPEPELPSPRGQQPVMRSPRASPRAPNSLAGILANRLADKGVDVAEDDAAAEAAWRSQVGAPVLQLSEDSSGVQPGQGLSRLI